MRLALLSIGNTHTRSAVFEDGVLTRHRHLPSEAVISQGDSAFRVLLDWTDGASFDSTVVSGVHPGTAAVASRVNSAVLIRHDSPWSFINATDMPAQVGVDRLLAVEGVSSHTPHSVSSFAVLDTGTAWTWNVASRASNEARELQFLGGAIFPGLDAARRGLMQSAPALSPALDEVQLYPPVFGGGVGGDTKSALESGFHILYVKGVNALIRSFTERGPVWLTGGNAAWLSDELTALKTPVQWDDHLVLKGMAQVALRLRGQSRGKLQ